MPVIGSLDISPKDVSSLTNCAVMYKPLLMLAATDNNLPRVVARIVPRSESNPRTLDHESSALTTTPPSHQLRWYRISDIEE